MNKELHGRVMLNGDCGSYFYNPEKWQPEGGSYSKVAIHRMIKSFADAGIDTFLINPNGQLPCYPSKRLRYQYQDYQRGDREYFRLYWRDCEGYSEGEELEQVLTQAIFSADMQLDLIEEGTDWLEETAIACREVGVSPWITVRMNDSHGGRTPSKGFMNNDLLKYKPELWLDKPCIDPKQKFNRFSLDYSKPESRKYMLDMIDDMLTYDFEGMELDFGRDPVIVEPIASDKTREDIVYWLTEIREHTNKKAKEIGKPFYLGIKASFHTGLLFDFGLDIDRCVDEGIFDFVSFSNYYQTSWDAPIDEQKKKYGDKVAVFGYIEGAVNWFTVMPSVDSHRPKTSRKRGRDMTYNGEMILGNAAGKLVLGADSLVFFNSFFAFDRLSKAKPAYYTINKLFDIENIRKKEKAYSFTTAFFYPLGTVALERTNAFPEYIWPSASRSFKLPMLAQNQAEFNLYIQLAVEKKEEYPRLAISINGHWPVADCEYTDKLLIPSGDFASLLDEHIGLNFTLPMSLIKDGYNEITIFNLFSESNNREENECRNFRIMNMDIAVMKKV